MSARDRSRPWRQVRHQRHWRRLELGRWAWRGNTWRRSTSRRDTSGWRQADGCRWRRDQRPLRAGRRALGRCDGRRRGGLVSPKLLVVGDLLVGVQQGDLGRGQFVEHALREVGVLAEGQRADEGHPLFSGIRDGFEIVLERLQTEELIVVQRAFRRADTQPFPIGVERLVHDGPAASELATTKLACDYRRSRRDWQARKGCAEAMAPATTGLAARCSTQVTGCEPPPSPACPAGADSLAGQEAGPTTILVVAGPLPP